MKPKFSDPPLEFPPTHPLPHFGRWCVCHEINISAGSQTNIKSSDNDSMTAEFYETVYQKTYLPNNFRLKILGNKKVFQKS